MRPGRGCGTWASGRARLMAEQVAQVQQMRDLLECSWPAVLDTARQPFKSTTWHAALTVARACTEQRMTAVLDQLGLTGLVTSITGLSAVGAAAILAETGDPRRFTTGRALARHSGLAPRQRPFGPVHRARYPASYPGRPAEGRH